MERILRCAHHERIMWRLHTNVWNFCDRKGLIKIKNYLPFLLTLKCQTKDPGRSSVIKADSQFWKFCLGVIYHFHGESDHFPVHKPKSVTGRFGIDQMWTIMCAATCQMIPSSLLLSCSLMVNLKCSRDRGRRGDRRHQCWIWRLSVTERVGQMMILLPWPQRHWSSWLVSTTSCTEIVSLLNSKLLSAIAGCGWIP